MSVHTEVGHKLDNIRHDLEQAMKGINEILMEKPWGYEDLSDGYKGKLRDLMMFLMKTIDEI